MCVSLISLASTTLIAAGKSALVCSVRLPVTMTTGMTAASREAAAASAVFAGQANGVLPTAHSVAMAFSLHRKCLMSFPVQVCRSSNMPAMRTRAGNRVGCSGFAQSVLESLVSGTTVNTPYLLPRMRHWPARPLRKPDISKAYSQRRQHEKERRHRMEVRRTLSIVDHEGIFPGNHRP